jgi:hypothetical protein
VNFFGEGALETVVGGVAVPLKEDGNVDGVQHDAVISWA